MTFQDRFLEASDSRNMHRSGAVQLQGRASARTTPAKERRPRDASATTALAPSTRTAWLVLRTRRSIARRRRSHGHRGPRRRSPARHGHTQPKRLRTVHYRRLLSSKWAWKRTTRACGGSLCKVKKALVHKRGHGRPFQRCTRCKKFFDVLVGSHLPTVKAALPVVVDVMVKYFASIRCPTANRIGSQLGISCDGVLRKLTRVPRAAEARCALQKQNARTVPGFPAVGLLSRMRCCKVVATLSW